MQRYLRQGAGYSPYHHPLGPKTRMRFLPLLALLVWNAPSRAQHAALGEDWVGMHRRPGPTTIALRVEDGSTLAVELTPIAVWEPGGTARVVGPDGKEQRLAPSVATFRASVPGRASSGFLGVSATLTDGYLTLDGESYAFSSEAGTVRLDAMPAAESAPPLCRASIPPPTTSPVVAPRSGLPTLRTADTFVEVDHPLRQVFGSSQEAVDYATLLVAASSEIYRRDLGVTFRLPDGYLRVWETPTPWPTLDPRFVQPAVEFGDWWRSAANPLSSLPRSLVHCLTHYYNPVSASFHWGWARDYLGICKRRTGYAVSSLVGNNRFPAPHTNRRNGDLYLFCHESAHVYGTAHTHEYSPPIGCDDGSGPDGGTLMSYCYGNPPVAPIGMRFHERVQDLLRAELPNFACLTVRTLDLGDYDANGVLDPRDLSAFDAVRAQGFVSRAAEEVFDMDRSGRVDDLDRALLVARLSQPATSLLFNGSGSNRLGYGPRSQPVLGQTWEAIVGLHSGVPLLTCLLAVLNRAQPPVLTRFGELLIEPPGGGGTLAFRSFAWTDGTVAVHRRDVPFDIGLVGLEIQSQAAVLAADGVELLNGLTLQFGSY